MKEKTTGGRGRTRNGHLIERRNRVGINKVLGIDKQVSKTDRRHDAQAHAALYRIVRCWNDAVEPYEINNNVVVTWALVSANVLLHFPVLLNITVVCVYVGDVSNKRGKSNCRENKRRQKRT